MLEMIKKLTIVLGEASGLVILHVFLIKEKTSGIVKTAIPTFLFKFAVAGNGVIVPMFVPASTVYFFTVITGS